MTFFRNYSLFTIILFFCIGHLSSCQSVDGEDAVIFPIVESFDEIIDTVDEELVEFADTTALNFQNDDCDVFREKIKSIQLTEQKLYFHELDYMFAPGGGVSGFYQDNKLVWLKSYHGSEAGGYGTDFYIEKDRVFAVYQYRDRYERIDAGHWDAQKRTRAIDRTIYLEEGDSICAEGTAIGIEFHGLRTLEVAMSDFKLMKEELDRAK